MQLKVSALDANWSPTAHKTITTRVDQIVKEIKTLKSKNSFEFVLIIQRVDMFGKTTPKEEEEEEEEEEEGTINVELSVIVEKITANGSISPQTRQRNKNKNNYT